ncbi:MAG: OmpA family protein, partial [Candidatus Kapaibacteriota bacterium]
DVWVTEKNQDGNWIKPIRLDSNINTTSSNSLLYIFPNNRKALVYGSYQKKSDNTFENCFAFSNYNNGKWQKPEPLIIEYFYNKSKNYSATISTDGKVLIMSLEREDSFGSLDLYISMFDPSKKTFSKPRNLGNKINTKGVELVAFLAYDNKTLYFASNGRHTKGKLDLFMVRRLDDSWLNWSSPEPLNFINSEWDENSLSLNITGDTAYFCSGDAIASREGLYFTTLEEKFRPLPYLVLQGKIYTVLNNQKVLVKEPVIFNVDNFEDNYVFTDTIYDGNYTFIVPNNTQYNFFVNSNKFEPYSFTTSSYNFSKVTIQNYDINLKPIRENVLGFTSSKFEVNNSRATSDDEKILLGRVYFDNNVDSLDSNGIIALQEICKELKKITSRKILVVGHTDEVGTSEYNLKLSLRRARNTAKTISSCLDIDVNLIEIEGKGKKQPISKDRALNRRVEIFILK